MKVYLVGAGPGDPGLITVKGRKILERADAVLYDNLASERLLEHAPPRAERIYVGKKRAQHEMSQEEISAVMIDRARRGWTVVRLKGGDPFIFGRGGEEMEALAAAGIPFEIVPGVTTPLGLAAYTGVPLTHREHTSAVTFVTGHNVEAIDWGKVGSAETVVLFMGLVNFAAIAREMIARGRSATTPAMVVRWATRPDQETLVGTLETLPGIIVQNGLRPPATIVIGEVVALRERFNWFEKLPLFGHRVIVTRDRRQAGELAEPLEELGAEVILLPVIEIQPPADPGPLDRAIACLDTYDWLIFTSANGVRAFVERLRDIRSLRAKVCAIGPATAAAVEALHIKVDRIPKEYVAESLLEALAGDDLAGKRILLPRAAVARDLVPVELTRRGAIVDVVEAYRTVIPEYAAAHAREVLARKPHWITFTSSSTVKNFVAVAGRDALKGVKIASIGPITSATARELGLTVDVEADPHTVPGLVVAIERWAELAKAPRYLTISDDLQIVPSEGYKFLSKSRRDLESAEREVTEWIDANPVHARYDEAQQWLTEAEEKIFEIQLRRRMETKRMQSAEREELIRREVHDYLWAKKVSFADLPRKTDELTKKIMAERGSE